MGYNLGIPVSSGEYGTIGRDIVADSPAGGDVGKFKHIHGRAIDSESPPDRAIKYALWLLSLVGNNRFCISQSGDELIQGRRSRSNCLYDQGCTGCCLGVLFCGTGT